MENHSMNPNHLLSLWLTEEQDKGAPEPQHAVLSTATMDAIPHARIVHIREFNEQGFLFFTQKRTRKVQELTKNPQATLTFWFELFEREVIIEGRVEMLDALEKEKYWQNTPRERQIRFYTTAPISSTPIVSKEDLEEQRAHIRRTHEGQTLAMPEWYYGFRLKPQRMVFYSYQSEALSDVVAYTLGKAGWNEQLLSP